MNGSAYTGCLAGHCVRFRLSYSRFCSGHQDFDPQPTTPQPTPSSMVTVTTTRPATRTEQYDALAEILNNTVPNATPTERYRVINAVRDYYADALAQI